MILGVESCDVCNEPLVSSLNSIIKLTPEIALPPVERNVIHGAGRANVSMTGLIMEM